MSVENAMILPYRGDVRADIERIGTMKHAWAIVGGLSDPEKMPDYGYSLPASRCITGSALAVIPGTTCFSCYAGDTVEWQQQGGRMQHRNGSLRGSRYATANVRGATERRYQSLTDPLWVPAMAYLLRGKRRETFRWHDSGDVQSAEHVANIFAVCRATPLVKHWMPTREKRIVETALCKYGPRPRNLVIRASATRVDGMPPKWPTSSMVVSGNAAPAGVYLCPAPTQGGRCGPCRRCWDQTTPVITYHLH